MNFLEKSIAYLSPGMARRRSEERFRMTATEKTHEAFSASFDGARKDRLTQGFTGLMGSADSEIIKDLPDLRARSRDLVFNSGWGASLHSVMVTNVVGTGLKPRWHFDHTLLGISEKRARRLEDQMQQAFADWVPFADAARTLDFYGIQRQAYSAKRMNGEFLVQPHIVKNMPGNDIGLVLQTIESDRLDAAFSAFGQNRVDTGVEIDAKFGAPVAYHIAKSHPGDAPAWFEDSDNFSRIAAFDKRGRRLMMHGYDIVRPGQTRGLPAFTPIIIETNDAKIYRGAELTGARMTAAIAFVINNAGNDIGTLTDTINGEAVTQISPGGIYQASEGLSIDQINPVRPGSDFPAFMRDIQRSASMSQGAAYEILMRDFSGSTYTALRAAFIEARKTYNVERKSAVVQPFCLPVLRWFTDLAVFRGIVRLPRYAENRALYMPREWIAPPEDQIDPFREAQAAKIAIDELISTRSLEIHKRGGGDVDSVFSQASREKKLMKEKGIVNEEEQRATDETLAGLGLEIGVSDTYERYGLEPPQEGEDTLSPKVTTSENIQIDKTPDSPAEPEEPEDG